MMYISLGIGLIIGVSVLVLVTVGIYFIRKRIIQKKRRANINIRPPAFVPENSDPVPSAPYLV